jgi:S1-C subfamily serine protease
MKNRISTLYLVVSVSVVVTLLLVILGAFAGGLILAPQLLEPARAAANPQAATETDLVAAYEQALIDIYHEALPSVVNIDVAQKIDHPPVDGFDSSPFSSPDSPNGGPDFFNRGQGSGFVWDKDGHIVTNYHVVGDATEIRVTFEDGRTVPAELLGGDPDADLAVIKVDLPASELQPVTVGDSSQLQVGQLAIAIGNPFGQEFTMTSGIVSAVGRTIRSGNSQFSIPEVIQTDAPINPGNSGGPLFNRQGEVIGINSQIISRSGSNSGIGFAVPINIAKQVVPTLIKGEKYEYAWLGITGQTLSPEAIDFMKLPADTKGALIIAVAKDGPAEKAGLLGSDKTMPEAGAEQPVGGDVITAINSQPIAEMDELITYLIAKTRPGDKVTLDVIRANGQSEQLNVTLGTRPSLTAESGQNK